MVEKKVTVMVIKVDLSCEKCRKKIKKLLCEIPQIQNQIYDEKANTVTITVVCCSPEKIKKKICCKGGDFIKGIEIKVPDKPKPPSPKNKDQKLEEPGKHGEPHGEPKKVEITKTDPPRTPEQPPRDPKGVPAQPPPVRTCCGECYEGYGGGPCYQGYRRPAPCYEGSGAPAQCYKPKPIPPKAPDPDTTPRAPELVPVRTCCRECYEGYGGGPCYQGYRRPAPCNEGREAPAPCYKPKPNPPKAPEPDTTPRAPELVPVRTCCRECYEGYGGGPCYQGYRRPAPCYEGREAPAPCYEAYGRPLYDSWGSVGYCGSCRKGCYVGRCDCVNEENPLACSVM